MLTREKKNKGAKRESETGNIAAETSTWSIGTSSHDFDQSLSDMSLASEELSLDCITDDNLKKEEWSIVVNRHTLKDEKGRHDSQNNEYSLVDDPIVHQNDRMIAGQLVSHKNNQTNVRLDHFLLSTKNMSIDNKGNDGNDGNEGNHKFSAEKCSKPTFPSSYYEQKYQESRGKNNPKNQKTVFWVTLSFCLISFTLLYSSFHFAHEMRAWRRKAINLENEVTRLKDEIDHLKRWQYDNESSEKCDYRFSVKNSWVEGDVRVSLGERGAEVSDAFWSTYDDFTNSLAVFYNDVKEELNTFQTGHKPKNGEVRSSEMQNLEQIIDPFDTYKKISREFIQDKQSNRWLNICHTMRMSKRVLQPEFVLNNYQNCRKDSKSVRKRNIEEEDYLRDLQERHSKLSREYKVLDKKHRGAVGHIRKLKNEIQNLRRRINNNLRVVKSAHLMHAGSCNKGIYDEIANSHPYDEDELEQMRNLLFEAEAQVKDLQIGKVCMQKENKELFEKIKEIEHEHLSYKKQNDELVGTCLKDQTFTSQAIQQKKILQSRLDESVKKIQIMQTNYSHLESKAVLQSEMQQKTLEKLRECNVVIQTLQNEVKSLRDENTKLKLNVNKVFKYEEQVLEVTAQNRFLENQLTQLCELPFSLKSCAMDENGTGAIEKVSKRICEESLCENDLEKIHTKILTYANDVYSLKKQVDSLRKKNSQLEQNLYKAGNEGSSLKGEIIETDSIKTHYSEKSNHIIQQKETRDYAKHLINKASQCTDLFSDKYNMKINELERELGDKERDLERKNYLMKTQVILNNDLENELQSASRDSLKSIKSLQNQVKQNQIIAAQRLERIRYLENQAKEKCFEFDRKNKAIQNVHTVDKHDVVDQFNDNLVDEKISSTINSDETILEVSIQDVEFCHELIIGRMVKSILILDLFGFESQASKVISGIYPTFQFTATYKLQLDSFCFHLLQHVPLKIELYSIEEVVNSPTISSLVASSSLLLKDLLENGELVTRSKMIGFDDNNVVGYTHVVMRTLPPIDKIYRAISEHKEASIPSPKKHNQSLVIPSSNISVNIEESMDSTHRCEMNLRIIKVSIDKCHDFIPKRKLYVHFQFLGFPDMFTSIHETDASGNIFFDKTFKFNVALRYLANRTINLYIFEVNDINDNEIEEAQSREKARGCSEFGSSILMLEPDEKERDVELELKNKNGEKMGSISLRIDFRGPKLCDKMVLLSNKIKEIDMRAVTLPFMCSDSQRLSYIDFLRIADPPLAVLALIQTIKLCFLRQYQELSLDRVNNMLSKKLSVNKNEKIDGFISYDHFINTMKQVCPENSEELSDIFRYLDVSCERRIRMETINLFLFSCEIDMIRNRFSNFSIVSEFIRSPFGNIDKENTGWMTYDQFIECLQGIGFVIDQNMMKI